MLVSSFGCSGTSLIPELDDPPSIGAFGQPGSSGGGSEIGSTFSFCSDGVDVIASGGSSVLLDLALSTLTALSALLQQRCNSKVPRLVSDLDL